MEVDVVGGIVWKVVPNIGGKSAQLGGARNDMGSKNLPIMVAVTAVDIDSARIIFGHNCAAYEKNAWQTKALLNLHELRNHGVLLNDEIIMDSRLKNKVIDEITIPLDFMDKKTLSFNIHEPKQEKLDELDVHWLILQEKTLSQQVKPSICNGTQY